MLGDPAGSAVQAQAAAVVPEPLPLADDVGWRRLREGLDRRPALEPGGVTRYDPRNLGLLEHDLADEDRVRVARPAPRKVAAEPLEPGAERVLHTSSLRRARARGGARSR